MMPGDVKNFKNFKNFKNVKGIKPSRLMPLALTPNAHSSADLIEELLRLVADDRRHDDPFRDAVAQPLGQRLDVRFVGRAGLAIQELDVFAGHREPGAL